MSERATRSWKRFIRSNDFVNGSASVAPAHTPP